jgi:hypothetical protein
MKTTRPVLAALLFFTVALAAAPQAKALTIADGVFCFRYDAATLQPVGVGNTVFTYSEKIGIWIKIIDPTAGVEYRIVWYDPSGSQFRQQAVTVVPKTGENWGIVFDSINIAETTAKDKLGVWDIKLLIDKEEEASAQFQIISYESLLQRITDATTQLNAVSSENDLLESQNQALTLQLQQLQASYTALQAQVGTSADYQQLQDDYDDLNSDYLALGRDLSTTRMMMYAAVVVAVASVGIAVYFGAIKKS